jgi:hypothetical protein
LVSRILRLEALPKRFRNSAEVYTEVEFFGCRVLCRPMEERILHGANPGGIPTEPAGVALREAAAKRWGTEGAGGE